MTSSTDGMQTEQKLNLPDLSKVLDQIDFDKKPLSHGRRGESAGRFSVAKWGALIIELLAYPEEEESILAEYGLTKNQYASLRGNKLFMKVWEETESSIVALAVSGGFQLNTRRIAEQSLDVLEEIIATGDDKERLKAIELNARFANLDPLVQAKLKENSSTVNTGVQLVVNFSNQLKPPAAFKDGGNVVIDTTAEVVSETGE